MRQGSLPRGPVLGEYELVRRLATGGMGDALTGVIASLLAQGFDAWGAAWTGVALHARAGDVAARDGEAGLIASDLLGPLRRLRNNFAAA